MEPIRVYQNSDEAQISEDGATVAAFQKGSVVLFDRDGTLPVWEHTPAKGDNDWDVSDLALSGDGTRFVVALSDHRGTYKVLAFDRASSDPLWSKTSKERIEDVGISGDGQYVVVGYSRGNLSLFETGSATPVWAHVSNGYNYQLFMAISDNGDLIVTSDHANVTLFGKNSSTPLWSRNIQERGGTWFSDTVESIDISGDGEYIVAGTQSGYLHLYSKDNSTELWNFTGDKINDHIWSVAISADGQHITTGASNVDNKVYLFGPDSPTPTWDHQVNAGVEGAGFDKVAIAANGRYLAASTSVPVSKLYVFDPNSTKPLWTYADYAYINDFDFSADGRYLLLETIGQTYLFDVEADLSLKSPQDGVSTGLATELSWESHGEGPWTYTVYLDGDPDPQTVVAQDLQASAYSPGKLAEGTYHWKVVADDGTRTFTSAVWSFTTSAKVFQPLWSYATEGSFNFGQVSLSASGREIDVSPRTGLQRLYHFDDHGPDVAWTHDLEGTALAVITSAGGENILVHADRKIHLFGRESATPLWNYSAKSYFDTVTMSSNGDYIMAVDPSTSEVLIFGRDSPVPIWNYSQDRGANHTHFLMGGCFSPEGDHFAIYSRTDLYLYQTEGFKRLWEAQIGDGRHNALLSANGEHLLVSTSSYETDGENALELYGKDGPDPVWRHTTQDSIYTYSFTAKGDRFLFADGSWNGQRKVYLHRTGQASPLWTYETQEALTAAQVSDDGRMIFVASNPMEGTYGGRILLFGTDSNEPQWIHVSKYRYGHALLSADGTRIVATQEWRNGIDYFVVPPLREAEEDDGEPIPWLYLLLPLILAVVLIAFLLTRKGKPLPAKPRPKPAPAPPAEDVDLEKCVYCGSTRQLHRGHLIAPSKRGIKPVSACSKCNTSKGKKALMEWLRWTKKERPERWEDIIAFNKGKRGEVPRKVQKIRDE